MNKLDDDTINMIYKKTVALPRLPKKMLHKNTEKNIRDAINKLKAICSHKVTNYETLINKYKKLTQFYISYLLIIYDPSVNFALSFIGKNKVKMLTNALFEMCVFWTKDIIINTLNNIVMSINFKAGKDERKKNIFSIVASFLSVIIYYHLNPDIYRSIINNTISKYNVTTIDINKLNNYKTESQIKESLLTMNKYWTNNDIYYYFNFIVSSANFDNTHTCSIDFIKFITNINEMGLLKKNIFEELVFNVVSKNAGVICKKIDDTLNQWLKEL